MSYGIFASYYDLLTRNVNYAGYAKRVNSLIKRYCPECKSIAEVACGTASLSFELEKFGYGVIGADLSAEMLKAAEKKKNAQCSNITLIKQDMRSLSLPSPVGAAVCSLDALNHLDSLEDVKRAFKSVYKNLRRGGVFIFDMNTPYKHREILGNNTFVYELPQVYTVWQNEYRAADCSVGITLDFFIKNGDSYERHTERFREKAYRRESVLAALRSCSFEPIGAFDELKNSVPRLRTERILYVSRRR